jgi:hypothetical protein
LPGQNAIQLSERARAELRPGDALVFDWHRLAICCAAAGDVSLRRTSEQEARGRGFKLLGEDAPTRVYAHPRAYPHLADRALQIDCKRSLGVRRFTSDLPADFGLRAILGRVPADPVTGGQR